MPLKGDEDFYNDFTQIRQFLIEYRENLSQLISILEKVEMKTSVIINPTTQNKLKVLSLPSMEELNDDLTTIINQMKKNVLEIKRKISNLKKFLETGEIKCKACNGSGKEYYEDIIREEGFVRTILRTRRCKRCEGSGYLRISKKVLEKYCRILDTLSQMC